MKKTPLWRSYLRFWRSNIAADVEDELRFHFVVSVDKPLEYLVIKQRRQELAIRWFVAR